MTIIQYKRNFLSVAETYGERKIDKNSSEQIDININTQLLIYPQEGPLVKKHNNNSVKVIIPTFIIDLSKEEQEIYNNIHKKVRQKIKRSLETEEFIYYEYYSPTDEQLIKFSLFFNAFAEDKKIEKCLLEKLLALKNNNSLFLTEIYDKNVNILCSHCLLIDKSTQQASGLYSASTRLTPNTDKSLIGRANKYLHWKEMQSLKKNGYKWYNLGGIVKGKNGQGINNFKIQLGAVRGYDQKLYQAKSLKGHLCKNLLYYKWKRYLRTTENEEKNPV